MKKTKLLLLAAFMVAITALLPACSIFRKRSTDVNKSSFSQTSESKEKKDSSVTKTDKSIIKEKEVIETSTESPAVNIKKENEGISLADLAKGVRAIDSGVYAVKVTYDSATKKLTTEVNKKPEKTNTKKTTEREIYNNKSEATNTNSQKQNKDATEVNNKSKATIAEPKGLAWLWGIIIGVVVVIMIGLLIYFKKFKKPG
jgi:beta-lactamase regulating signal transducer with metallopeptidase domain